MHEDVYTAHDSRWIKVSERMSNTHAQKIRGVAVSLQTSPTHFKSNFGKRKCTANVLRSLCGRHATDPRRRRANRKVPSLLRKKLYRHFRSPDIGQKTYNETMASRTIMDGANSNIQRPQGPTRPRSKSGNIQEPPHPEISAPTEGEGEQTLC